MAYVKVVAVKTLVVAVGSSQACAMVPDRHSRKGEHWRIGNGGRRSDQSAHRRAAFGLITGFLHSPLSDPLQGPGDGAYTFGCSHLSLGTTLGWDPDWEWWLVPGRWVPYCRD